jgi:hypothetical protein
VSTKRAQTPSGSANAPTEHRDTEAEDATKEAEQEAARLARSAEITVEFASVAAALCEGEDVFSDVPTVANRTNPTASSSEIDEGQGSAGAGAYRMVRPGTSDRIAVPAPATHQRPSGNRVIIGVVRRSH